MNREERVVWIQNELSRLAGNGEDDKPLLEPFFIGGDDPRPIVVICPGGGYGFTSPRESAPVARAYNGRGYHALVLHYRVAPHRYPEGLRDVSRTVALVRSCAEDLGVIPENIALCGFSAGGHLAASLAVHWDEPVLREECCPERGMNRPDVMILCYPVITGGEYRHAGSFDNLLGEENSTEAREYHSLEKQITPGTPPCFIWHTENDGSVPVENSYLFAMGLRRAGVTHELHVYPFGAHGASLATAETNTAETVHEDSHVATWMDLSGRWLEDMFRQETRDEK